MTFTQKLQNSMVVLDGAMGTLLQAAGLAPGEQPEEWNLSHPSVIQGIHEEYI